MDAKAADIWDYQTGQRLAGLYSDYFQFLQVSDRALQNFVHSVRAGALAHGISEKRDVFKLAVVATVTGAYFFDDPRFEWMNSASL